MAWRDRSSQAKIFCDGAAANFFLSSEGVGSTRKERTYGPTCIHTLGQADTSPSSCPYARKHLRQCTRSWPLGRGNGSAAPYPHNRHCKRSSYSSHERWGADGVRAFVNSEDGNLDNRRFLRFAVPWFDAPSETSQGEQRSPPGKEAARERGKQLADGEARDSRPPKAGLRPFDDPPHLIGPVEC